jgi:hypothetical protein
MDAVLHTIKELFTVILGSETSNRRNSSLLSCQPSLFPTCCVSCKLKEMGWKFPFPEVVSKSHKVQSHKPKEQTPLGAFQDFWFECMQIQYFKTVKPVKSKVLEINSSKSIQMFMNHHLSWKRQRLVSSLGFGCSFPRFEE